MTQNTYNRMGNPKPGEQVGLRALQERRVDPGTNATNPPRVNPPSKLSTIIPKGPNNTGIKV